MLKSNGLNSILKDALWDEDCPWLIYLLLTPTLSNVGLYVIISNINDGHNYNIKPNPKGQETDRNLVRCSQIKVLAAQNMEEREQTIAVNIKVSGVQRRKTKWEKKKTQTLILVESSAILDFQHFYFFPFPTSF